MKVIIKKRNITFEAVEIQFPFYELIQEIGDDAEMPFESYVRITENDYTKITIKSLEINILHFKRKFDYLAESAGEHLDFQKESKKAFEIALKQVKDNVETL